MKKQMVISIMLYLIIQQGLAMRRFSTEVEQNMETLALPNNQLLLIQSYMDEQGVKKIILQNYLKDSTKVGKPLIIGNSDVQCTRPKVTLSQNVGFAIGWVETQIEQSNFVIQVFSFDFTAIIQSQVIGPLHLEVHWDMVSEFHYLKQISGTKFLLFYKPPNVAKYWNGLVFDYKDYTKTDLVLLPHSKILDIAINRIKTIVVLQMKDNSQETRYTIMNINGQIVRVEFSTQSYNNIKIQRGIIALSNNNFLVLSDQGWSSLFIYDSRFLTILRTNSFNYYQPDQTTGIDTSWEYQNYFVSGTIQLQALEESLVLVGIDTFSFKFRLVHLKNSLEFIQFREVNYENINIYKYSIQQTSDNSIFVQWVDGLPETLIPEYKQAIYQSELDLQLSINHCQSNCQQCISKQACLKCSNNYNLVNNQCEPQCKANCKICTNIETCQICDDGYFFNSQFACVLDNKNISEVRISNSDTTSKQGNKFKVLDNRNIVIVYREQDLTNELLQIKLLDQYGNQIFSQQIKLIGFINYDLSIQDSIVYVYVMTLTIDNGLELLNQLQLPQKANNLFYYQFDYFSSSQNFFQVVQFSQTFIITLSGFTDQNLQRIISITYDYNGNKINDYFYGDYYIGKLFFYNAQQFDIFQCDNLMYLIVTKECELSLTVLNEFGNFVLQDIQRQFSFCQYFTNPSISKTPNSLEILFAIQDAYNQIKVFSWLSSDLLYSIKSNGEVTQPKIIALDSNSFILVYLESNIKNNYITINYLHFEKGQVISKNIVNQHSIQPKDVSISTYYDQEYIFLTWVGFKNLMEISTNQIYLQQISISDDQIVGLVKICSPNCLECQNYNICSLCIEGYQLTSICQSPSNSQIASLRDGSIVVSWFQDEWIYVQKVDRNGVIQPIDTVICPNHCNRCTSQNNCDVCQNGFQLNSSYQCDDICIIENCASCQYWSHFCRLCNYGYFLDDSFQQFNPIDQQNGSEKSLSISNVYTYSTVLINNSVDDLIHIWINKDSNGNQLLGESYTNDGSLIIASKLIIVFGDIGQYQIQAVYNGQYDTLLVLLI